MQGQHRWHTHGARVRDLLTKDASLDGAVGIRRQLRLDGVGLIEV